MTPTDFRAAIAKLDLTQNDTAGFLRVGIRTVRRWAAGDGNIPYSAEALLRLMVALNIRPVGLLKILKSWDQK